MKRVYFIAAVGVLFFAGLMACEQADQPEKETEIVMAEDSELALLMRDMTEETVAIRRALKNGEQHPLWNRIEELHTATPTDSTRTGPIFGAFSDSFIRSVKEMESADSLKVKHFNAVIDRCMDCHGTYCPGPMKRIKMLYVRE